MTAYIYFKQNRNILYSLAASRADLLAWSADLKSFG